MWTASFWKQGAERALKTFAQVMVTFLVVGETGFLDVDWTQAASVSGVAAVASVLTSLASAPFGQEDSPSIVEVK
jgi:hypothetical protein